MRFTIQSLFFTQVSLPVVLALFAFELGSSVSTPHNLRVYSMPYKDSEKKKEYDRALQKKRYLESKQKTLATKAKATQRKRQSRAKKRVEKMSNDSNVTSPPIDTTNNSANHNALERRGLAEVAGTETQLQPRPSLPDWKEIGREDLDIPDEDMTFLDSQMNRFFGNNATRSAAMKTAATAMNTAAAQESEMIAASFRMVLGRARKRQRLTASPSNMEAIDLPPQENPIREAPPSKPAAGDGQSFNDSSYVKTPFGYIPRAKTSPTGGSPFGNIPRAETPPTAGESPFGNIPRAESEEKPLFSTSPGGMGRPTAAGNRPTTAGSAPSPSGKSTSTRSDIFADVHAEFPPAQLQTQASPAGKKKSSAPYFGKMGFSAANVQGPRPGFTFGASARSSEEASPAQPTFPFGPRVPNQNQAARTYASPSASPLPTSISFSKRRARSDEEY